jgi:outer membrane immunogenic protein
VKSSLVQTATNGYVVDSSATTTRAGWTLGAGAEMAFMARWSAKFEYLYYDMGRDTVATNGTGGFTGDFYAVSQKTAGHLLRAGLNYRF